MGLAYLGTYPKSGAFEFTASAALDTRFVVKNYKDLFDKNTWYNAANGYIWYNGLTVFAQDTKKAYTLIDGHGLESLLNTGATIANSNKGKYWRENASIDSLNESILALGPVFTFKGVATAIDPDHTTLTIGAATVSGSIGVAPNIKLFENKLLISYGTVLQENLDSVKYAWGTSEYPNLFFTDKLYTTKDDEGQALYERGAEKDLQYINVFDTLYFYKPNQDKTVNYTIPSLVSGGSPTTGTRTYKVWEALDKGGILYSLKEEGAQTLDVYTVTSTAELPTALKTGVSVSTYKYYQFTEIADASKYTVKINNSANAVTSVTASSENNGHVYQIGEEEYASNGNMWVQLGSPKTDWIVL